VEVGGIFSHFVVYMQKTTIYLKEIEGEKMRNNKGFKFFRVLFVIVIVAFTVLCAILPSLH